MLDPQGPVGAAERTILLDSTAIMLAVILPVMALTLGFAWWFRAGNAKAVYLPDWEFSGRIEVVVWSIPILIVSFLGGMAWIGAHELDPRAPIPSQTPPIDVQVVSLDWKWLFIYPSLGVASVNRLVLPVGTPARFALTSSGVMNSFFVPQLGSQIYTMSGMTTHLGLVADRPGSYGGLSAQFSGDGFSDMRFEVSALDKSAFDDWVKAAKAGGGALDDKAYAELARPSENVKPKTYGEVASGLFEIAATSRPPDSATADAGFKVCTAAHARN